MPYKVIN